ncbi:unnamed protein product [Rotaria socialis]|uniref:Uncharacterized protein n=2 Tax=Rotaria socialis TaxID=392032 RepID=A0A821SC94_9BILA|nr:unnamed protein product [Rotaria socialis]CAF4446871.1 unnamed protein product [Rotaria socialis]CAF4740884.1 unnamed protein product [Rotaria socialis]CAF4854419.1 unnamed protein product [Rotaria socialis]
MMMTMDQPSGYENAFMNYHNQNNSFNQSILSFADPDVDWSVLENADRYLLRDDSAWITRLSKDFWWNLERISEMAITDVSPTQQMNTTKQKPQQNLSSSIQSNGISTRKIVGQRTTIARPNRNNIPMTQNSSSIYDQDIDYNPFQSKVSFDNNIWANYTQQAIPWDAPIPSPTNSDQFQFQSMPTNSDSNQCRPIPGIEWTRIGIGAPLDSRDVAIPF